MTTYVKTDPKTLTNNKKKKNPNNDNFKNTV